MRNIKIGFSTPKKFKVTSWLIQKFERSEYSHIFIIMEGNPRSAVPFDKVFQASHGDVNAIHIDNFLKDNHVFKDYTISISDEKYSAAATWLWKQLGKPYGFMQLVAIALGMNKSTNGAKAFICSELAGRLLEDFLGYNISKKMDTLGLVDVDKILAKELK
jgi:hypothetical protein